MRGYPRFNFPAFEAAAKRLREEGHVVLSPAERDLAEGFDPDNPGEITLARYEAWMAKAIAEIDTCDAVYMLIGWANSPGACREYDHAVAHDKWVLFEGEPTRVMSSTRSEDWWEGWKGGDA